MRKTENRDPPNKCEGLDETPNEEEQMQRTEEQKSEKIEKHFTLGSGSGSGIGSELKAIFSFCKQVEICHDHQHEAESAKTAAGVASVTKLRRKLLNRKVHFLPP